MSVQRFLVNALIRGFEALQMFIYGVQQALFTFGSSDAELFVVIYNGCFFDRIVACRMLAGHALSGADIRLPFLGHFKNAIILLYFDEFRLNVIHLQHTLELGVEKTSLYHRDPFTFKIEKILHVLARCGVELPPCRKDRYSVEIEVLIPLFRLQDTGKNIDSAFPQPLEALRPGTVDELKLPALLLRDRLQNIHVNPRRLSFSVPINQRLKVINPHPDRLFGRLQAVDTQDQEY